MTFSEMSVEFAGDFRKWRASRPEWAALAKAVRADAPENELLRLAADAGANQEEVNELVGLRKNAQRRAEEAARYPAAKKELERLDQEVSTLHAQAEKASAARYDEASGRVSSAWEKRNAYHRDQFIGTELAHNCVAAAKEAGLL